MLDRKGPCGSQLRWIPPLSAFGFLKRKHTCLIDDIRNSEFAFQATVAHVPVIRATNKFATFDHETKFEKTQSWFRNKTKYWVTNPKCDKVTNPKCVWSGVSGTGKPNMKLVFI